MNDDIHPMNAESKQIDTSEPRIDRSAFSVFNSFAEADAADKAYWLSRTPDERVSYMEYLRRVNYGARASEPLQRVLEIVTLKHYKQRPEEAENSADPPKDQS